MFYVPLYVEALRSRPVLVFWLAALAQAFLWLLVPFLFYSAPPGDLPRVLAIGHEFPLNGSFGPPLAYWLAEIAFRIGGLFGVYALAQTCVVAIYWCVFALARAIVGGTYAALAVLLMAGIAVFTVPTPDFGPPLLAAALWSAVLLLYWRAVTQKRPRAWYELCAAAVLLLLTTDAALMLLGLLVLFTALTGRARAVVSGATEPWIVAGVLVCAVFLHTAWLEGGSNGFAPVFERLRQADMGYENTASWVWLLGALVIAHAGAAILVVLASGWPRTYIGPSPALARLPVDMFAVTYVRTFAFLPALAATIAAVLIGSRLPVGGAAPLLVLSGLAVVVAAGDRVELFHQRTLGFAWAGLLIVPALFVPVVLALMPWTLGTDLRVAQPATAMGRFFSESFERRTGHPLAIVGGDDRTAELVALASPSRPSVFFVADPARSPWVTMQDIAAKGAVVVWPASEMSPDPPPAIKARFPDLAVEVPQTFARPVRGRLPLLRIGWGMIRPASAPAPSAPAH